METNKSAQNDGLIVLASAVERYIFSKPLQGDNAREVYKEVKERVAKDFRGAPEFDAYFEFNKQTGEINGSNTYYGILIGDVLRKSGLWLPTIAEAKKLDVAGKLKNDVWREYGIAVYDNQAPNSEIAKILVEEACKRDWQLPILAPFKALKLRKDRNQQEVGISFSKDAQGIILGEEAKEYLAKQIDYKGSNGACRLYRGRLGYWGADDGDLRDSSDYGRVDFVCGEATTKNLESAIIEEINKTIQSEVEKINNRISNARQAAIDALKS